MNNRIANFLLIVAGISSVSSIVLLSMGYLCVYDVKITLNSESFWAILYLPFISLLLLIIRNALISMPKRLFFGLLLFLGLIGGVLLIVLFRPISYHYYNNFLNIQQLIAGGLLVSTPYLVIIRGKKYLAVAATMVVAILIIVFNPWFGYKGELIYNSCKDDVLEKIEENQNIYQF
jgi:hypothetical protein